MRIGMIMAALAIAAPASAQVTLAPGQGVSVMVNPSGSATPGDPEAAGLDGADLEALAQLRKSYAVNKPAQAGTAGVLPPIAMNDGVAKPRPIVPDRIEFVFVVTDGESLLVVRNGYRQGLTYRARITRRGRTAPTDVCLVMPGKRNYEHWPYPIETIELSAFHLADWSPEDGVPCR